MTTVIVIDKRSGEPRQLEERQARVLVALGKAEYASERYRPRPLEEFATVDEWAAQPPVHGYETRHMEAAPTKRRGRPPGSKNSQLTSDKP